MYISEIRTKAPADERMPLERKFYDTLEKLKYHMNRWIMIRHLRWKNVQKWIKRSEQRSGRMFSSVTKRRQPSFCW